ncbi:MAG: hypothetical protein P8X82_02485 [Gemmatimonadales bacterium]
MIIFFVAVFVTGFTAKKIENISQPGYGNYGKALIAQMLIGPLSLGGLMMFGLYLDAPPILAFAIAYSFIPIVIYKIVFPCMWREAALIWIVVLLVLSALTYVLLLVGWISLSSIIGG